jgi:hypothetical protein
MTEETSATDNFPFWVFWGPWIYGAMDGNGNTHDGSNPIISQIPIIG